MIRMRMMNCALFMTLARHSRDFMTLETQNISNSTTLDSKSIELEWYGRLKRK